MSTDTALILRLRAIDESQGVLAAARANIAEFDAQIAAMGARSAESADTQRAMQSSLTATGAAARSTAATLKGDYTSAVARGADEQLRLGSITEATAGKITGAKSALDSYTAAMQIASGESEALAAKQEAAYLRMERAGTAAYEREATQAEASFARQAKAAEVAAAKQDAAMIKVGKSAGLLTLGVAGIAYETSKMASTFQRDMEMVRTEAGASQAEVNKMSGAMLKLSSETGTGPDQLAQALFHVESAGFRGAKALDMVRLAAEGAKIGNADLESTTNAVIGVMVSQIKGVHDATDAMAALTAIVGMGNVKMSDLVQAIGTGVLPSFANFGLGIRDFAAAESVLTDNSFGAVEGATKLRMSVSLIGAPSGAAAKALEAVGLSASEANAQLKDINGLTQYGVHLSQLSADLRQPDGLLVVLKDLQSHLIASGLTATEQGAVIARAFGGGRSGAAIETLYQQLDRLQDKYKVYGADVLKFTDDWNATTKTTAFQAAQAKANADALGISIGQSLVPATTEFLKVITPAAEELAQFVAHHKALTADLLVGAGLVAGTVAVVGGVMKVVGAVKTLGLAWNAVAAKAALARDAEIGASLGLLGGVALVAGIVGHEVQNHTDANRDAAALDAKKQLNAAYEKGTLSTRDYVNALKSLSDISPAVHALTQAQVEGTKAGKEHAAAVDHESVSLDINTGKFRDNRLAVLALGSAHSSAGKELLASVDLQKQIAEAQKKVDAAINAANGDLAAGRPISAQHQADLTRTKTILADLQDRYSRLSSTIDLYSKANKTAEAQIKSLNASQITLAEQGLAKEQAAFRSMADSAIDEARRMRSGVTSEYDAMLAHITKSIPLGTLERPGGTQTTFLGPNQFPTKGPAGSPAASAAALDPEVAGANSLLASTIKSFPAEFQGAFDSELAKYKSQESALYTTYIQALNKEDKADADAINKINSDYQKGLAANWATAQSKDKAEHDRYLQALQTAEGNYNGKLSGSLQSFNTNFQTALASFQAAEVAAQTKAETDATQHEDRLRQLEADTLAKLAAVHGKNAAEQRATIDAAYAKSVGLENSRYNGLVTANEAYLKNLGIKFDGHVAGLKGLFEKQQRDAAAQLTKDEKAAKGKDTSALQGIQKWLDGRDSKAESTREAALAKEAGIYVKVVNGIVEAFDKGGHLIAQHMLQDTSAQGQIATLTSKGQNGYDKAVAQAELDIIKHGQVTAKDALALSNAIDMQDKLTAAQKKALDSQIVQNPVPGFRQANFGNVGQPGAALPAIGPGLAGGFAGTVQGVIAGSKGLENVFQNLVTTGTASIASQKQQTLANLQVAENGHDTATTFSILDQLYLAGEKGLNGLVVTLPEVVAAEKADAATKLESTRRQIDLDKAIGNTSDELTQTLALYHDGNATLADVDQAYRDNAAAVKKATDEDLAFLLDTGQFTAALESETKGITDALGNARDKVTLDFLNGTNPATDVAAAQGPIDAQNQLTQASWNSAFALADLATKSGMLSQLMSSTVSQASTIRGLQSSVDNANLQVIAANSAIEVHEIQSETTAVKDLGGIITASANLQKATFDGRLAALHDLVPIIHDQYALAQATDPLAIKIAETQLALDRSVAAMDQVDAAWQVRLAEDALQTARDQLMVDQADSAAQGQLLMDQLTVAQDEAQMAADDQKLGIDQLTVLNSIDSTLAGVEQYAALIDGDLQNLNTDQSQLSTDQTTQAVDQGFANDTSAAGQYILASDSLGTAQDQASASAASQGFQLAQADYQVQLAQLQELQKTNATLTENTAALQSQVKTLQALLTQKNSPAGRSSTGLRNPGSNVTLTQLMGPQASDFQANVTP